MEGAEAISFGARPTSLPVSSSQQQGHFRSRRAQRMSSASSMRGAAQRLTSHESGADVAATARDRGAMPRTFSLPEMFRQMTVNSARVPGRILSKYRITNDTHVDSLLNLLSGLYAMCIVVMGAALPCAKVFATEISIETFEAFYIYLFLISILFIVYVIVYILHDNKPPSFQSVRRLCTRLCRRKETEDTSTKCKEATDSLHTETGSLLDVNATTSSRRSTSRDSGLERLAYSMHSRSESFYLRLGAIAFGIASVLHNGLQFGQFVELATKAECQTELILVVRPVAQLVFIFMQLYFVFLYSTICIHSYRKIARFGAMHLVGTNLCVWLRVITIETVREIHDFLPQVIFDSGFSEAIGEIDIDEFDASAEHNDHHATNASFINSHLKRRAVGQTSTLRNTTQQPLQAPNSPTCGQHSLMGSIVDSSSPYLYPFTIEYYFIAAAIGFVIWNNIGSRPEDLTTSTSTVDLPRRQLSRSSLLNMKKKKVRVDCSGAHRGLFAGILILVLTIISIIVFFVYMDRKDTALMIRHASQIILYGVACLINLAAAFRIRNLRFKVNQSQQLEEALLVLSLIGVFLFRLFNVVAGNYVSHGELVMGTNILIIVQATVQTVFLLNGLHRRAQNLRQETTRPGRDCITFLLLCNIAIWVINIFEALRSDTNHISMKFYGTVPWCIITHIVTPLAIFHQFHATVCLSVIWKSAYKFKSD